MGLFLILVFGDVRHPRHSQWRRSGRRASTYPKTPPIKLDTNELENVIADRTETGYLRLPKTLEPSYYKLRLIPHLEEKKLDWKLEGNITIVVTCIQPTNQVVLHAVNLTVITAAVIVIGRMPNDPITILNTSSQEKRNFFTITLNQELEAGIQYEISLGYESRVADGGGDLNGFYRSHYTDLPTNTTK